MITAAQIKRVCPSARADLVKTIVDLWPEAQAIGLTKPLRVQHFFAQIATETGGLKALEEGLNYTAARMMRVWPKRFPTAASAAPFARNPEALANKVYGGRLGNIKPGDGWRYRGRSMLQTTGRDNYRAMGFEDNPEALAEPATAFRVALREWKKRGCNALADRDDVVAVREAINGGVIGLADTKQYLAVARKAFVTV